MKVVILLFVLIRINVLYLRKEVDLLMYGLFVNSMFEKEYEIVYVLGFNIVIIEFCSFIF